MSVFKKYKGKRITPKDKNWSRATYYVWKRVDGRIIHKALKGAQTKAEAEAAERKIIEDAFNKRYGIRSREKFGEFVERVYRNYVRQNNSNQANKRTNIAYLVQAIGKREVADITPQEMRNIQAKFRQRFSASTVNQLMSTASKIFTLAGQEGIVDRNPMQFVSRLKEPPPRNRLLSKEEKERLWEALEKDHLLWSLVILATNLPLRRGQLLAITPDAIDWQTGTLSVVASKGRAARIIPLNTVVTNTLRLMISDGQLPFPLKETGVRKRWVKALKRAKIENFRFHDLRKLFAAELRRHGMHTKTIQDLFGHSSARITDIYLPTEFETMREAVNSLDDVNEVEGVQ